MELSIDTVLGIFAFGLLIVVSGGILYLTTLEWRDRRRRDQDSKIRR